jgi:glycosyltransferase XagB
MWSGGAKGWITRFSPVIAALVALTMAGSSEAATTIAGTAPFSRSATVDWSAGAVARWTGYSRSGGSLRVREVQRRLRTHDYRPGPVDGLFGPRTERAVVRFQRAEALPQDGIVGPRTLRRLRVRAADQRAATRSPRSGAPSTDSPTAAPAPAPRAAPALESKTPPAPAEPEAGGGSAGVVLLVALVALIVLYLLLLAVLALASAVGRRPAAAAAGELLALTAGPPIEPVAEEAQGEQRAQPGYRLGDMLRQTGAVSRKDLDTALQVQERSGGRLGEILSAYGVVPVDALTHALARRLRIRAIEDGDSPIPLLAAADARAWRAVAIEAVSSGSLQDGAVPVAMADPADELVERIARKLARPVEPRLCDEATLDDLLQTVYGDRDADEVVRALREDAPDLSAYRRGLSGAQTAIACTIGSLLVIGMFVDVGFTARVLVSMATAFFVSSTGFRLYAAWKGSRPGATIDPAAAQLAEMDERELPLYTVLLPLYKEKPATVRALFNSLSCIDYPKHKLDAMLLIEADDAHTRAAIKQVGRPPWMRVLQLPPGTPRTKPRAMGIGLRYAKGTLVAVYDAEDKPDPAQLKKAVWGFHRTDPSVACLQAKLGYYNPRQNLLTRWFTLEYDGWFNIFLPGLHRIGAPIPLGGTSNHFRRDALEQCLGWDPYNVTEDADLGLRFARLGLTTTMLESTTGEEANSQVVNWLRQRSRWSKGYMQTVLVHTRRPWRLLRELGVKGTTVFLLTIGGAFVTALLAPVFWILLLLWGFFQPEWIAALFPGPVYYAASVSLVAGNFALVFLSLGAAVSRGHDDLAPHALLIPCYWALMSAAAYLALIELFVRPYHWHKTEHGLHVAEEPA